MTWPYPFTVSELMARVAEKEQANAERNEESIQRVRKARPKARKPKPIPDWLEGIDLADDFYDDMLLLESEGLR